MSYTVALVIHTPWWSRLFDKTV